MGNNLFSFLKNKNNLFILIFFLIGVFLIFSFSLHINSDPDNKFLCSFWSPEGSEFENPNWQICLDFMNKIDENGISGAFDMYLDLYESNSSFRSGGCHLLSHVIGRKIYYENGGDIMSFEIFESIPAKERTCAVKAYHGFFREYFINEGLGEKELNHAVDYCDRTKDKFDYSSINGVIDHCYAGIGYGLLSANAVSTGPESEEITSRSIDKCEEYIESGRDIYQCYHGVFESLRTAYAGQNLLPGVNFEITKDNVLDVCKSQDSKEKQLSCFIAFRPLVWDLYDQDFHSVISVLEEISPEIASYIAESYTGGAFVKFLNRGLSEDEMVSECLSIPDKFHSNCVSELAFRMLITNNEEMAVNFCSSNMLSENNKAACFERLNESLSDLFTKDDALEICNNIPDSFWRSDCLSSQ